MDPRTVVASLYESLLARQPVDGEEVFLVELLENGGSVGDAVSAILQLPESQIRIYRNPRFDPILAPPPLPIDVPRLYVWHIPKTAGTSLREMLRSHFDALEFGGSLAPGELYRMSQYKLRSFRVITGHFGPSLPQLLGDVPLITATLLRDPVATVTSIYRFQREHGDPTDPFTILANELTFSDWCRREETRWQWSNPQAKALTSRSLPPSDSEYRVSPDVLLVRGDPSYGPQMPVPEDQLLELSWSTLAGIDIVGGTDDLLEVYRACLRRLGMEPTLTEAIEENVTNGASVNVSPGDRDWLLDHNGADAMLFLEATKRGNALHESASNHDVSGWAVGTAGHAELRLERENLPIPPENMRELVGRIDPADFDNPTRALVYPDIAQSTGDIFDFGCGCGRIARQLIQQSPQPRSYVGIDLHAGMIRWCQTNLSPCAPQFHFVHQDVFNVGFNPAGSMNRAELPAADESVDFIIAISVFTHLLERDVKHYLNECSRILRPNGVLLSTWFLFDKREFPMMQESQNALYINVEDPINAVIFDREWLITSCQEAGLALSRVEPPETRGFHWWIRLERNAQPGPFMLPDDEAPFGSVPPPVPKTRADLIGHL
jgi:SAM-dependent methyltransferase